jgi:hypothetical protein
MPLPPPPKDLLAQIKAKKDAGAESSTPLFLSQIKSKQKEAEPGKQRAAVSADAPTSASANTSKDVTIPQGKLFTYNNETSSFLFDLTSSSAINPRLAPDAHSNPDVDIVVPLAHVSTA